MFDFDVGKLLLIGVVALIFIPPKDLPGALRQLGRLVAQARRMAADFQNQFSEAVREAELTELKDEFDHMKKSASLDGALAHVADMLEPLDAKAEPKTVPKVEAKIEPLPEVLPAPEPEAPAPPPEKQMQSPLAENQP